jgi:hypothetical protein
MPWTSALSVFVTPFWVESDDPGFRLRSVTGMGLSRLSLRAGGRFRVRRVSGRDQRW